MVTKEHAMTCRNFLQVSEWNSKGIDCTMPIDKPIRWRANGKCKTWKRDSSRFQLPIKYGLYSYGYLTNENAHLFIVEE